MTLNEAQKKIVKDIAVSQIKDITFIIVSGKFKEIARDLQGQNYEVTATEVALELRSQLNQWAKVKREPDEFGTLLNSTEKGWLRHHVFHYFMDHDFDSQGLWEKLDIQEDLDKLNLN